MDVLLAGAMVAVLTEGDRRKTFRRLAGSCFTGMARLMDLASSLLPKLYSILGPFAITSSALLFGGIVGISSSRSWTPNSRPPRKSVPGGNQQAKLCHVRFPSGAPVRFFAMLDRATVACGQLPALLMMLWSDWSHMEWHGSLGSFWRSLF